MMGFVILSIILLSAALFLTQGSSQVTIARTFVISKLFSFAYWFAYSAPFFALKYPTDKRRFYEKLRRKQVDVENGETNTVRKESTKNVGDLDSDHEVEEESILSLPHTTFASS